MGRVSKAALSNGSETIRDGTDAPTSAALVRRLTSDLVAERIRGMIFDGELRPGDRLDQEQLASALGVSRLPVREAVQSMAQDGLLRLEPHAGAFVAPFDADTLRDHFEIVGLVQGLAAGRVAARRDPAVLEILERLADEIRDEPDPQRAWDLSWEFQRVINREGASDRQRAVLRSLARMLPSGFFIGMPGGADSERAGAQAIWHAITTGYPDVVSRACVEVLRGRAELVIRSLTADGVLTEDVDSPKN